MTRKVLLALTVVALATPARALNVSGEIATDTVWRVSDNPVVITSTVHVASGVTLRVEPGVQVTSSAGHGITSDGIFKVGFDENGQGDATKLTTFRGGGTRGSWSGINLNTGTAAFLNAEIAFATNNLTVGSANVTADDTTIRDASTFGVNVANAAGAFVLRGSVPAVIGTPKARLATNGGGSSGGGISSNGAITLTNVDIVGNYNGIYSTGSSQVSGCFIRSNTGWGTYLQNASAGGSQAFNYNVVWKNGLGGLYALVSVAVTFMVDHNTFVGNDTSSQAATNVAEVTVSQSAGTLTLTNNILTDSRGYALKGARSAGTLNLHHNLLANTIYGSQFTAAATDVNCRPLFAATDGTNFRLTENSPARDASSDTPARDLGALPYTSDPTVGLWGILRQNLTIRKADGPQSLLGDLTVAPGVTLTLEPGAVVRPATSDGLKCGADAARAELRVRGSLKAAGTAADPIVIGLNIPSRGTWAGLRFETGSLANQISFLDLNSALTGLTVESAGLTVSDSKIRECSTAGVSVAAGASLTFNGTLATSRVENNGGVGLINAGTLTLDSTTVATNGTYGVQSTGSSQIVGSDVNGNGVVSAAQGLYLTNALPGGTQTVSRTLVRNNTGGGIISNLSQSNASHVFDHDTLDNNEGTSSGTTYEVYFSVSSGTSTLRNSLVTNNRNYGVGRTGSSGTVTLSRNDVWGNALGNYVGVTADAASFSANPLYVSATNLRLTENSPAREADDQTPAQDLGALAYAGDPTTVLAGTLRSNRTLTKAGSPWAIPGDLTVAPGVTLTLEAGARLTPAQSDLMGGGAVPTLTELIVLGRLVAVGTAQDRIVMLPTNQTGGNWEGVRFDGTTGAQSQFDFVEVGWANNCVRVKSTGVTIRNARIHDCSGYGISVEAGASATVTGNPGTRGGLFELESRVWNVVNTAVNAAGDLVLQNTDVGPTSTTAVAFSAKLTATQNRLHNAVSGYGLNGTVSVAGSVVSQNLIYANGYAGVYFTTGNTTGTLSFDHNTVDTNGSYGVYLTHTTGNASTYVLRGNVVTSNGSYGFYKSGSATLTQPAYNLVRGHSSGDWLGFTLGTGNLSTDPKFNAAASRDYRLQPTSPARGADGATPAGDMGALPYAPIAVGSITVSPATNPSVPATRTQAFTAVATEAVTNVPIAGLSYNWSIVAGGGSIDGNGLFTAGCTTGTFANTVEASANGVSGAAGVTVTGGPTASITVKPPIANMGLSSSTTYTAELRDACGNLTSEAVSWTVAQSLAGVISSAGVFTSGQKAGTFTDAIVATGNVTGVKGRATVIIAPGALDRIVVTPANASVPATQTGRFTATGFDFYSNPIPVTPTWSLTNCTLGTIDASTGVFTAGTGTGNCTNGIVASQSGKSGTTSVTVTSGSGSGLASITVTGSVASVGTNGAVKFTATGKDGTGASVAVNPTWSVTSGGGTIDATGSYTAGCTAGTFTVTATQTGVTGTASITVNAGTVATLTIGPNPASVAVNASQQFTVTSAKDGCGNDVTATPTWSVAQGGGAIDTNGKFTAGATLGTFTNTVRAVAGAALAQATVTVTAGTLATIAVTPSPAQVTIGGTVKLTATGRDSAGNPLAITPTWTVPNGGGTVDGTGNFTAGNTAGTYTVRVASGSINGTAQVTVNAGPLVALAIAPTNASVAVGASQTFTASGKDAGGNTVPATWTWSVVAGGGTIDQTGRFTAGTLAGPYVNTVKATSGAISATASVTVLPGPLTTLTVAPNTATLAVGRTQQFTASGKDAAGNVITVTPSWNVVAGGGTISSGGVFTAGNAPGTFLNTVRATSGSVSATATVVVQAGPLAEIVINPDPAEVDIGSTLQLTATGYDLAGNLVAIQPTWTVEHGGGTISPTGLFTPGTKAGFFEQTLVASSGAVSGALDVTVNPGPVVRLAVRPVTGTMQIFENYQFGAVGLDAYDNESPVAATWSVTGASGIVSSSGLFRANGAVGTFENAVKATSGQMSATANVVILPGPVQYITLTPGDVTLPILGTQRFTATGIDEAGNPTSFAPYWSVTAGGFIDQNGLFTAGTVSGTFDGAVVVEAGNAIAGARVTITPDAPVQLSLAPSPAEVRARGTLAFSAVAQDRFGNVSEASPTWSVSVPAAGTIDAAGLFTAGRVAGAYARAVTARQGALSASADVLVTPGALVEVTVSPDRTTLRSAEKATFTAEGRDVDDNLVILQPAWSVQARAGTITSGGEFTAGETPGDYPNSIRATASDVSGYASVTITPAEVKRLVVAPASPVVPMGRRHTFQATAYGVRNQVVQGVNPTWAVVDGGGTIDAGNGVFTAGVVEGTFTGTVEATVDGVKGATSVIVPRDFDQDGIPDALEVAAGLDDTNPQDATQDFDRDGLVNRDEVNAGTNPSDGDSDEDGVLDGQEPSWREDTDQDLLINALDSDSDGDGLFDGTEMGLAQAQPPTDTTKGSFIADADPATTTDPLTADTDGDTLVDGQEDRDHDGLFGKGETDPNSPEPACGADDSCAEGLYCQHSLCLPALKCVPECGSGFECGLDGVCTKTDDSETPRRSTGCGCAGAEVPAAALALLAFLGRRKRQ